jgi:hypothetical protein
MKCPLCESKQFEFKAEVSKPFTRKYYQCKNCELIFSDPKSLLDHDQERQRYLMHENDKREPGYEKFLNRLITPMQSRVDREMKGLDFGSGPYPMLCEMMQEEGFDISAWDPYYLNDRKLLLKKYDYMTCCEVVEHFNHPRESWQEMFKLLKSKFVLGVSTSLYRDDICFSDWHYILDETHISFYTSKTMQVIAKIFSVNFQILENNIILFFNKD